MEPEGSLPRLQQPVICHYKSLKKNTENTVLLFTPSFRSVIYSLHMEHYCSHRNKGRRGKGKMRQEFTLISSIHALHLHVVKRT